MTVTIGTWTTDPNGQQWYYSVSGWTKGSGFSGGNPVEWSDISDADRPTTVGQVVDTGDSSSSENVTLAIGPLEGATPGGGTKRWPNDQIQEKTDYVFFQFGKYIPPLSQDAHEDTINKREGYNQSISRMKVDTDLPSIMLPIPQDLSNTLAAGWQGKAFTGLGRAAVAAMAGGEISAMATKIKDYTGNLKAIQESLTSSVLNLVPGVGGNLDVNDISGATRGVVLNPNAELLYDSPELREIGMSFKMVPRNDTEAKIIRDICQIFRKASLPTWGASDDGKPVKGLQTFKQDDNQTVTNIKPPEQFMGENFIRVPRLCKFTFMQGNRTHDYLTQFKPCAMSGVVVNFTPDNTYATYHDGSPVATELRINFQETKLIFAHDVTIGGKGGSF